MKDLIIIKTQNINGAEVNTVNARDIHEYLEVRTKFADWIKSRLDNLGAIENGDYISFSEKKKRKQEKDIK
jgi:anti-repressor protein